MLRSAIATGVAALVTLVGGSACGQAASSGSPAMSATGVSIGQDPVRVVAVGDIAAADNADAGVALGVAALQPRALLLVGDIAYPAGSTSDFASYFTPDWGRFANIWMSVPGNHEYRTSGAAGYRAYFAKTGALYWSKRVGDWVIIGLDSEQPKSSGQLKWLKKTLKKYNGIPTLVAAHTPRYSSGMHGDQPQEAKLWNQFRADDDVKVVVWGHDHDYERMSIPVAGRSGPLSAFVVGTGGGELRETPTLPTRAWRKFYVDQVYGALALDLGDAGFQWQFVTDSGTVQDSGTIQF